MTLTDFFKTKNLENSLLIGYYGGTNYGDELLLEVLQNIFKNAGVKKLFIYYSDPRNYATYHHDFGYTPVSSNWEIFKAIIKSKNIIVGGGGLWGLDANLTTLLFSALLLFSRFILQKKIYLLGVGYYNSTTLLGHAAALLAAFSASEILARDNETYQNFRKIAKHTHLDKDISSYLPNLSLSSYLEEAHNIIESLRLAQGVVIIGLRRFQKKHRNLYMERVEEVVHSESRTRFLLVIFESKEMAPQEYEFAGKLANKYKNCSASDFSVNPLAFYYSLLLSKKSVSIVAPQFHVQITAYQNDIPFLPIDYDAKNREFFNSRSIQPYHHIKKITSEEIIRFLQQRHGSWRYQ